jgi:hypothetical protein
MQQASPTVHVTIPESYAWRARQSFILLVTSRPESDRRRIDRVLDGDADRLLLEAEALEEHERAAPGGASWRNTKYPILLKGFDHGR